MKKTWQAPQLIILTRSRPEEAILTGCKVYGGGGTASSPVNFEVACEADPCSYCFDAVSS